MDSPSPADSRPLAANDSITSLGNQQMLSVNNVTLDGRSMTPSKSAAGTALQMTELVLSWSHETLESSEVASLGMLMVRWSGLLSTDFEPVQMTIAGILMIISRTVPRWTLVELVGYQTHPPRQASLLGKTIQCNSCFVNTDAWLQRIAMVPTCQNAVFFLRLDQTDPKPR